MKSPTPSHTPSVASLAPSQNGSTSGETKQSEDAERDGSDRTSRRRSQTRSERSMSITSLASDMSSRHYNDNLEMFNQDVPLDLRSVASEAVSRQVSRIQSRRSSKIAEEDDNRDLEAIGKSVSVNSVNEGNYGRFSNKTKILCLTLSASSGFLAPLSSLTILPAIPEIAARFNTTQEVINVSNAIFCIFMSLSPCLFSPCSDIYGRRPMFLICAFFYSVSCALVAVSQNLAMFYIFRCTTALFGTSFFSFGGHIVGDIYHPTQRGRAMAYLVAGAQVGTGFGPVFGGIIVTYTSWRVILWVMMALGAIVFGLALFFLPETSAEIPHTLLLQEVRKEHPKKKFVFIPFNPLKIMTALKYPNLSIDGFISIAVIYTMFMLQTPIRAVLQPRFHLTSPIYSGLFYLAPGCGYILGSLFGGPIADRTVKKYMKIKGRRIPEDRLRAILIPLGITYPVSVLIYGWCIYFEKGGMAVPIVFLFIGGVSQTCIFPASNAYCVDSMPELGGDGIGSSYFSRYIAAAIASATCLRSIENIGLGWTCTITAIVLWIGFGCAVVLIYWGEGMRIRALVKYGLREA